MKLAALLLAMAACLACGGGESRTRETLMIDEALKRDLAELSGVPVFFGHHSVGDDILAGLRELEQAAGCKLSIAEERVGENNQPLRKFEDFAQHAERAGAQGEPLMLMKLCFVDFEPQSKVPDLVEAYAQAVARVRKARPGVKLVHVTPPLCSRPSGLKTALKRLLGKPVWEDDCNARRAEFREALLRRFPGEPVLDLGLLESTRPDGTRELHSVGGTDVPMLWPGYTHDGGHLNEAGKRMAARAFVQALARARRG